jgi:hypothetical protein
MLEMRPLPEQDRDAAVKTIRAVDASLASRSDSPKVVICIQTDGQENQSTEHTWEELRGFDRDQAEGGMGVQLPRRRH